MSRRLTEFYVFLLADLLFTDKNHNNGTKNNIEQIISLPLKSRYDFYHVVYFREGVRLNWRNSSHGNDTRPIWISNVRCSGDEYSITVCPYDVYDNAAKIQTCTHVNDLAIRCKSPLGKRSFIRLIVTISCSEGFPTSSGCLGYASLFHCGTPW